ncbi:unnamed protein product [Didymodactylos carnosus]|uniref:Uncharacterized protein n=1 Tax=Didymodactylos carnosus TaxID=1234261 RepID=A0A814JGN3_9BILA|nr:unnamed protein product [Didymodactylos carnosus]CAF3807870.1 unnamed protein product [Didymodactylos carnosus]
MEPQAGNDNDAAEVVDKKAKEKWEMEKTAVQNFQEHFVQQNINVNTNREKISIIDVETGRHFRYSSSIWWYSWNEAFIYRQINNILRMENIELLISYRYFIIDLCQMIKKRYHEQRKQRPTMVYRAEWIEQGQFDSLEDASTEKEQLQLISMNGFISTTTDRTISELYANKECTRPNVVAVIYEIRIDPSKSCTEFALIEDISYHPEEKEVLFSIGAVFSVDSIQEPKAPNNFYTVQLTACEYNETIIDDVKLKIRNYTQPELFILIGKYLIELEQYRTVKKTFNALLESKQILENGPSLVSAYNCIGMMHSRMDLYGDAIQYYKQALKYQSKFDLSDNNTLAACYNNIGSVLLKQNYIDEALANFNEALRIQSREPLDKEQNLVSIYSNIGRVYTKKENYDKAEEFFIKVEKLIDQNKDELTYDALEKSLTIADAKLHHAILKGIMDKDSVSDVSLYYNVPQTYAKLLPFSHPKHTNALKHLIISSILSGKFCYTEELVDRVTKLQTINRRNVLELFNLTACLYVHEKSTNFRDFSKAMNIWKKIIIRIMNTEFNTKNNYNVNNVIYESYETAIAYYKKQEINSQVLFNLGILFTLQDDVENALSYLTQAMTNSDLDKSDVFLCLIILGNLNVLEQNYSAAVEYYNTATLVSNENISNEYISNDYMKIELYLAKANCDKINALQILIHLVENMKLLNNDLDDEIIKQRTMAYEKLSHELMKRKSYTLAFIYVNKAINLKSKYLSKNHPHLAQSYLLIGKIFEEKGNFNKALESYEKALEIQHVNLPQNHADIMNVKLEIGHLYCKMEKLDKLEVFYVTRDQYNIPECNASITILLSATAELYRKRKEYWLALHREQESNNIRQSQLSQIIIQTVKQKPNITMEKLKQLLPTTKSMLKVILQNLLYIYMELSKIQYKTQGGNGKKEEDAKNDWIESKKKARNIRSKLFSLWTIEEKRVHHTDDEENMLYRNEGSGPHIIAKLRQKKERYQSLIHKEKKKLLNLTKQKPVDFLTNTDGNLQFISEFLASFALKKLSSITENILSRLYIDCGTICIQLFNYSEAIQMFFQAFQLHIEDVQNTTTRGNKIVDDFIDILQTSSSTSITTIIDTLHAILYYYFPDEITMMINDKIWLLLNIAMLHRAHEEDETAIKYYNDALQQLLADNNEKKNYLKIAAIQFIILGLFRPEQKEAGSLSLPSSLLSPNDALLLDRLTKKSTKEVEREFNENVFRDRILAQNKSIEFYKEHTIGQCLTDIGDHIAGIAYWTNILEDQEQHVSKILMKIISSPTSTVRQIYNEMKRMDIEFVQQLKSIAQSYKKMAVDTEEEANKDILRDIDMAINEYEQSGEFYAISKFIMLISGDDCNQIELYNKEMSRLEINLRNVKRNYYGVCSNCQELLVPVQYKCTTCNDNYSLFQTNLSSKDKEWSWKFGVLLGSV